MGMDEVHVAVEEVKRLMGEGMTLEEAIEEAEIEGVEREYVLGYFGYS